MDKIATPPLTLVEAQQLVSASCDVRPAARALTFSLCREAINLAPVVRPTNVGEAARDNAELLLHLAFDDSSTPIPAATLRELAERCGAIALTRAGLSQH